MASCLLTISFAFAAAFSVTSATWTSSTSQWKISGAGAASTVVGVNNAKTWDYLGSPKGNTSGTWSLTTTNSDTTLVPCILSARQGFVSVQKTVTSAPANCTGSNQSVKYGLVASYTFDEGSGAAALDTSGRGHSGQLLSGATWVTTGKNSGAIHFDGKSGRIQIPDDPDFNFTTGMTLEAWVYPEIISGWQTVVIKEAPGALTYSLYASSDTVYPKSYLDSRFAASSAKLTVNTWNHLTATFDGANLRIYINGVEKKVVVAAGAITTSSGILSIGGNTVWGEFFKGKMDDVRIYNRALSPAEITTDMGRSAAVRSVDFDNPTPTSASGSLIGSFEGVDFTGSDAVWKQGPFSGNSTNYALSPSGVGSFQFVLSGKLLTITVSSSTNGTISLSDNLGQNTTANLVANTPQVIALNWPNASSVVFWNFPSGVVLDNIAWTAPAYVPPPPTTASLVANPVSIVSGDSSTLTWSSLNATSCTGAGFDTNGTLSGSISVSPLSTTTYSVSCVGLSGTANATAGITVTPPPVPSISLVASPTAIIAGGTSTLNWTATNATSCSASWTSISATTGSELVAPSTTTTYDMSCVGPGGTIVVSAAVTVGSQQSLGLAWDAPADIARITQYCVYMSDVSGGTYPPESKQCVDVTLVSTAYTFIAPPSIQKYFVVTAVGTDTNGQPSESLHSNELPWTTQ